MPEIESSQKLVSQVYQQSRARLEIVKSRRPGPLPLADKILLGHLDDPASSELDRGSSYVALRPDRVAMQDATAQMALLQFMQAGRDETAVPATVHCDHLVRAHTGAKNDLATARKENSEVYDFLSTACSRYGLGFWGPSSGIIHQVVLENYAFPGGLMIGTDSHTPNAGGLGMCAAGVGGADAVDVLAGFAWEVLLPKVTGVRLVGELSGWAAPKDIILALLGMLSVKGGTNRVIEYFGEGTAAISCTGKATICNMGAELGATCSVFPFDQRMALYLRATGRSELADLAEKADDLLTADAEVAESPERYYDEVYEIDLSKLEPHVVGPHTPDLARPISQLAGDTARENYPDRISTALVGSCTNSSYEDLTRAADIARQAADLGLVMKSNLLVSPGSDTIFKTIARDGQMNALSAVGAEVLANACGPCIGQWQRDDIEKGQADSILTSFNRNFPGRNDSNPETLAFIASPEIVMALGLAGSLSFNPLVDELLAPDGSKARLTAPLEAPEIPENGFVESRSGYQAPPSNGSSTEIEIAPDSERLALLEPFAARVESDFQRMPLLLKTSGKTTTDHISPAGPWLRYRGHLDRISDNMFTGATRAGSGERGTTTNPLDGERQAVPVVARALRAAGKQWVVVGDENYGEGSSREHAAMSPRLLGAAAVIVRSFARIHESNLKKQGILPLVFSDSNDYELVLADDEISIAGALDLEPGVPLLATLHHASGSNDEITLKHTLNHEQISWLKAGSALNKLRDSET